MVRIVNGEIVPDDAPGRPQTRPAANAQGQSSGGPTGRIGRIGGSAGNSSTGAGGGGGQMGGLGGTQGAQGQGGQQRDLMGYLASLVGVEGQNLTIPSVFGRPPVEIPLIFVILIGLLTLVFGWKILLFAALLWFLSTQNPNAPSHAQMQQAQMQQQAQGGGTGGPQSPDGSGGRAVRMGSGGPGGTGSANKSPAANTKEFGGRGQTLGKT
uniref:DUF4605 domain-containing protein n=1 Tax=Chromera velia CCMP2878 TaxID=1169474 RepID=A0A0G4H9T1_9ALVE|eukprot:Cvel_25398.t1-p1 / transcript=Cvel_25398.t1 / gene=Cvel_25398 / organism=Chromera_velia_CCMP2878 / gene_product=hypothetical protein / transcript_product=hypothetical protein / location=Cvel_scaffold2872:13674-16053(-) / protein_length=210 / sequence_SO=supercontig / SO=protein_coding / is_pseudo=false